MTSLPRAAGLALWMNAWLRGVASPDDVHAALGEDLHHVFIGLEADRPMLWAEALAAFRRLGSRAAVALTAPGDPVGLAGPAHFNTAVMEAGEALLLPQVGLGFVPRRVGGAMEWRGQRAATPVALDPRESRQLLRQELRQVTEELVTLGVTTWSPEIPDLLMNPGQDLSLPPGMDGRATQTLTSAAMCLAIIDAATGVEPGAISAWERSRFEAAMRRLDNAARRALVAFCSSGSDSLASP